ncbi:MAG: translation initiation factor IF-2 [Flavobacteriaceae bacterium]|nr:translation initiation factor IF-2 [Flavobacteriaceae bacterium]
MSKIRLNKAIKEFNISTSRLVEFLASKGFEVESNPNTQLEPEAYAALKAEFAKDGEQRKASHEVVISKVPETKLEIVEEEKPQIIKAKAPEIKNKAKVLGKIDLEPKAKEEVKETPKEEKTQDAPKPKVEEVKKEENFKEQQPKKEAPVSKQEAKQEVVEGEPEKIETKYQKLDGPKILKQKVDLSQFENKSKPSEKKKQRKRIQKPTNETKPAQGGDKKPFKKEDRPQAKGGKKGGKREKVMPVELTDEQVKNQIKETLEKLTNKGGKSKSAKYRKEKRTFRREQDELQQELEAKDRTLKVTEFITVSELAALMDATPTEVISACFSLGVMVTMNQRLEADILTLVADEFGYKIEFSDADLEEGTEDEVEDNEEDLLPRAPIVTVMGHVDHGKTSLLDYIRKTNVIAGESGGITQHIGAYGVKLESGRKITFLDTPGHEAFTAMRARGAQVTDIAIIVVAADDEVMPQTKEAISHAQAAGVPMIIAINKVDKPTANPDKIREQLSLLNILVEEWGGNVQSQEISAKMGTNIDLLLEKVLLQADILELKANPEKSASGVVIEASLDKGRGYVSTLLIQAGTLKVGDYVLAGKNHGKVKAILDERGHNLKEAGPSTPVTILGLDGAPTAGDKFKVYEDEREAKSIANKREQLQREQTIRTKKHLTLDEIGRRIALGDFKELNIILKGDVDGSVEALTDMLQRLSTEEIQVNILHKGVGQITESDILLATASDAIVIGFNVRAGANAKDLAEKEEIEIRTYSVIYDAIDEVKEAMEGLLSPEIKEQVIGNVEIREVFKISKVGSIAGCMVLSGKVTRNSKVRLLRDGIVKHDGELESLKRYKDDVKEVTKGYECGLNLKGYNDIEIGDVLEVYEEVAVKKKLK